jgi:CheY-like chemotaxis protein
MDGYEICRRLRANPVTQGIPFLGFTVFPTHRRLKRSKGMAFGRKLRAMLSDYHAAKLRRERIDCCVRGWLNHVRYGDTWGLRTALLRGVRL